MRNPIEIKKLGTVFWKLNYSNDQETQEYWKISFRLSLLELDVAPFVSFGQEADGWILWLFSKKFNYSRENKSVPVQPFWILRVVVHDLVEQYL